MISNYTSNILKIHIWETNLFDRNRQKACTLPKNLPNIIQKDTAFKQSQAVYKLFKSKLASKN